MIEYLKELDINWFKAVHNGMANDFLDHLLPIMRNKLTWIPVYLIFIVYSIKKYGMRSWIVIVMAILTIVVADQISAGLIKESVQRLRPCNEPLLRSYIRRLVDCGSGYSFVSAHATNHFAIAVIFTWFFSSLNKWWGFKFLFYLWAAVIAFSQVYVGVHYPFDVILGMFLGLIIGFLMLNLLKYSLKKIN